MINTIIINIIIITVIMIKIYIIITINIICIIFIVNIAFSKAPVKFSVVSLPPCPIIFSTFSFISLCSFVNYNQ